MCTLPWAIPLPSWNIIENFLTLALTVLILWNFLCVGSCHLCIGIILLLLLHFAYLFVAFSCLNAPARTSLKSLLCFQAKVGEMFNLLPLWFHQSPLSYWKSSPLLLVSKYLCHDSMLDFVKSACVLTEVTYSFSSFCSNSVIYYIDGFSYVEPPSHPQEKSYLFVLLLPCCWIWFASNSMRVFASELISYIGLLFSYVVVIWLWYQNNDAL